MSPTFFIGTFGNLNIIETAANCAKDIRDLVDMLKDIYRYQFSASLRKQWTIQLKSEDDVQDSIVTAKD